MSWSTCRHTPCSESLHVVRYSMVGGVSHWMKMVASLRTKHPDSLPLQVR
jgi:uncharacterized short protein YbdD (DUF466 family)